MISAEAVPSYRVQGIDIFIFKIHSRILKSHPGAWTNPEVLVIAWPLAKDSLLPTQP